MPRIRANAPHMNAFIWGIESRNAPLKCYCLLTPGWATTRHDNSNQPRNMRSAASVPGAQQRLQAARKAHLLIIATAQRPGPAASSSLSGVMRHRDGPEAWGQAQRSTHLRRRPGPQSRKSRFAREARMVWRRERRTPPTRAMAAAPTR
uniref:Uncharacterized protein n=1 Tax=mine drainage metagenome TaxID=410659 RepID=E6PUF1_9ZZZZ